MHARLIAAIADIDLQGLQRPTRNRRKRNPVEQRPRVAHSIFPLSKLPYRRKLPRHSRHVTLRRLGTAQIRVSFDHLAPPSRAREPNTPRLRLFQPPMACALLRLRPDGARLCARELPSMRHRQIAESNGRLARDCAPN